MSEFNSLNNHLQQLNINNVERSYGEHPPQRHDDVVNERRRQRRAQIHDIANEQRDHTAQEHHLRRRQRRTQIRETANEQQRRQRAHADHTEQQHDIASERRRRRRIDENDSSSYAACNCNIDTFDPNTAGIIPHYLGPMEFECDYCHALGFECEIKRDKHMNHMGKMCCNQGKVKLNPPPPAPIELYKLYTLDDQRSKTFRELVRYFNAGMAMGSIQVDDQTVYQGGPAAFKVHGQMYKRIGPMLPASPSVYGDGTPKCLQIYFCDAEEQANLRARQDIGVRRTRTTYRRHKEIFKLLHRILTSCGNRHLNRFLTIKEEVERTRINPDDVQIVIDTNPSEGRHRGRFGAPASTEIFALLPDRTNSNENVSKYAIMTPMRQSDPSQNPIRRIPDYSGVHDPLLYPLLRPRGEEGWYRNMRTSEGTKVSVRDHARFYMMDRVLTNIDPDDDNKTVQTHSIHQLSRKLYQQYICDAWAKAESNDLGWVESNQHALFADQYVNLKKRAAQNTTGGATPTVLPSTYSGSDRYMYKKFQDAMALSRVFGRPHLFITFTMDVYCKEVMEQLMPGQNPYDRPDIISRVYWQKYKAFIREIEKDGIFGKCIARCSTVEFQKRGAPHTHTLIWIENFDDSPTNLDSIISAEIPPRGQEGTQQRELYDLVTGKMIHGPCSHGWACWNDNCCGKNFPFAFNNNTIIGDDYYPQYRRRSPENGGNIGTTRSGKQVDNRWVVPYNAYLLLKYRAHINVQYVVSIASIKYLFKYNHKGHDLLSVNMENDPDEVKDYITKRYISATFAAWNLFGFHMEEIKPPVLQLQVHLEEGQRVMYRNTERGVANALNRGRNTHLTGFFLANEYGTLLNHPDYLEAAETLYEDMPQHYVYNTDNKMWTKRVRHGDPHTVAAIGRMPLFTPNHGELFYLRTLLKHTKGAISFEALRTVDGTVHPTYQNACVALHLVENDFVWITTMEEAVQVKMPIALRDLFGSIIIHCHPNDKVGLYRRFESNMLEDYLQLHLRNGTRIESALLLARNDLLLYLNTFFQGFRSTNDSFGIPMPDIRLNQGGIDTELDPGADAYFSENISLIDSNAEQLAFFREMKSYIDEGRGGFFGLDAPAGTGKSFLINLILAYTRKDNGIGIACAISGIASLILRLGTTYHKRWHPPNHLTGQDTCNIPLDSEEAQIIRQAKFIAIDEASMMEYELLDCTDTFLKQLMNSDEPFGGKLIVLIFDLRQLPPVVIHGRRASVAAKSIKNSRVWQHIQIRHLTKNMRIEQLLNTNRDTDREAQLRWFERWILDIGNGTVSPSVKFGNDTLIPLPQSMVCPSPNDVRDKVYPNFPLHYSDKQWLKERCILGCKNDLIQQRNNEMIDILPGEVFESFSIDSCVNDSDTYHFDSSVLNDQEPSGLPPHYLRLKKDACVILIRSLIPKKGFCNGKRCLVKGFRNNLLILSPLDSNGPDILVPRLPMVCEDSKLGIPFVRRQYPVLLSYYITVNRSQGQTLKVTGLELPDSVFNHGQIYTSMSRGGDPINLHIYADQTVFSTLPPGVLQNGVSYIKNVVWPELLLKE